MKGVGPKKTWEKMGRRGRDVARVKTHTPELGVPGCGASPVPLGAFN